MNKEKQYSKVKIMLKFLVYWIRAGNAHDIHSPFVFNLYKVLAPPRPSPAPPRPSPAPPRPSPKGGEGDKYRFETISRKEGMMLWRLVRYFGFGKILELGTCIGESTRYLSAANPDAEVISIDKDGKKLEIARKRLNEAGVNNVSLVHATFDKGMEAGLNKLGRVDLVFMDGDHREEPTLRCFGQIKPYLHNDSQVIIHDIHYSPGMERAWKTISRDPMVKVSIDLFRMGLIFFKEELSKQEYMLRSF